MAQAETCSSCNGKGYVSCPICNGKGNIMKNSVRTVTKKGDLFGGFDITEKITECQSCQGTGKLLCKLCGGVGKLAK